MLTVGLTGGIGSGKSTVARRLRDAGAVVVDADAIAREVLEVGGDGLRRVVERFGGRVLAADGSLDRAALAGVVFDDEQARRDLEAITHPLIAARTQENVDAAPEDAVVVHDVPLLVEKRMGGRYHLVVVVEAPAQTRVRRLVGRGLTESDAQARMSHQASDAARREAADVVLDNSGDEEDLLRRVDAVWNDRIVPYAENLRAGRFHRRPTPVVSPYDPRWQQQAARLVDRLSHVLGERAPEIEHVGSTSVPGMAGKDVVDIQVGVRDLRDADDPAFVAALAAAGFPRVEDYRMDHPTDAMPDPSLWVKRFHGSCDPGRVAHVHVRELSSAGWQYALLFRDWLRGDPAAREEYTRIKEDLAEAHESNAAYAAAKEPWFNEAWPRMQTWARRTGWHD
ncbi:dephospho-CoA kinase [Mobilicoccus pelagius]|uniref:Dephospho-CoA kinase n=1 Tax=Mobilicoccus pelagius NBRC 104925 TaxID=1089455 RepID=H5UTR1_9MICO|nr:dephospho-CoA kinase [Mobilicoccus pelagius]GAB49119.1 dephospho-CoA kinase [Mobilicoccus pelagius NBRC 104925]